MSKKTTVFRPYSDRTMTLQEWIDEQKADLDRFATMWTQNSKEDPEHWPSNMEPGEWDEQFRAESHL